MSYTLNYTGDEINAILARANNGGEIDDELALKAPLASPALTGNPTAPTQPEEDSSTKIATTEYADRAADAAEAAAEAAAKEYTDAATSALYITDTASGSIASFSDGADGAPMRSVKASIEPVQDLHGYDAPWPAGGGKNKLNPTGESQLKNGITLTKLSDGTFTASGTNTASSSIALLIGEFVARNGETYILNGCPSGGSLNTYRLDVRTGETSIKFSADTGSGFTFTADADETLYVYARFVGNYAISGTLLFKPMIRLSTETDATFAPYSNECPISGWTGAEIPVTGINVWDEEWELGSISSDTGQNTSATANIRSKNYSPCVPNTNLYFGGNSGQAFAGIRWYGADKAYLGFVSSGNANNRVVTVPANVYFFRLAFVTTYGATYKNDVSINYPSSDHDYHAYAGQTYPISWETQAGEVFGGHFVVNSDGSVDLTRTWGGKDMGTLTWTYEASPNRFKTEGLVGEIKPPTAATVVVNAISSLYKPVPSSSLTDGSFASGITGNVFVKDTRYTVAADFKAAVAGQTIVYEFAQPVVCRISAQQITSLLGQNNVWSNTGDVEVTYVADPKLYIAKMLGGSTLTLPSVNVLSVNRPVAISEEDLEQAGEVSEAVEAAAETVLPVESGETEEGAQE